MSSIENIDKVAWDIALRWAYLLDPFVDDNTISDFAKYKIGYEMGCCRATVQTKFKAYKEQQTVSSLLPKRPGPRKGKYYILEQMEEKIQKAIKDHYQTPEKPTIYSTWEEACRLCHGAGLAEPKYSTVRRRIKAIPRKTKIISREGLRTYESKYSRASQQLIAEYPLQIVQFDHTPTDLMVVDDDTRKSIGRPYLSAIIDVYSRMILGYWFDLEHPNTWTVSEVMTQSVFPKDQWLKEMKIDLSWPSHGVFETLMMDNAKEFKSKAMSMGSAEYGIKPFYTVPGIANLRGHIERVFSTFKNKFHELPGTTFSNIKERGSYDSEGRAIFTLSELNYFFGVYLLGRYHRDEHSELGAAPMDVWNDAIERGFNPRLCKQDQLKFRTDFIKSEPRVVRNRGIQWGKEFYWNEVVQSMYEVGVRNIRARPFHNDITRLLIQEDNGDLHVIPNSNFNLKPISWAEYRAIKVADKRFENSGLSYEERVEQVHRERKLVADSARLTKAARRKNQIDKSKKGAPVRDIRANKFQEKCKENSSPIPLKFKKFEVIGGNDD
ncbi:MAG: DNA-binding domain-containing protein [Maricaulaceae bacterium]